MANILFYGYLTPYRIDIYNAFHSRLGCEIYFFWNHDTSQDHDMRKLEDQCIFKPHFTKGVSYKERKLNIDTWYILSKEKPNLVIVPEFKLLSVMVLLYRWLFRKKFKVVALCDDSYDMVVNNHEFTRMHRWARSVVAPRVDNIILVDNKTVDWYKEKYHKGIWLPLIRDEKKEYALYEKAQEYTTIFRNNYSLEGKKVLLFVGRFVPVKNLFLLLEAVNLAKEDFVTVFVGSGILENELKSKAKDVNKEVIFPGRFEGEMLRAWYLLADVFILSSTQEAFGAVTNEALLAGCYCLISKKCGSSCLINEKNGHVFDPNNVQDIASSIDVSMKDIHLTDRRNRKSLMPFTFEEMFQRVESEI